MIAQQRGGVQHWDEGRSGQSGGEKNDRTEPEERGSGGRNQVLFAKQLPQIGIGPKDACAAAVLNARLDPSNHAAQQRSGADEHEHLQQVDGKRHANLM